MLIIEIDKINMSSYIKNADWIDDIQFNPEFSDEYYKYNEWLLKVKEFDYELKLNYELIKINNIKRCILKLQDMSKLRFEEFSKMTDYMVVNKKSPIDNSEIKPQFELPKSLSGDKENDNNDIFKSKLSLLDDLEKKNTDNKNINLSNAIAEFELFEYFQLRHLRMREFRYTLLSQFNYLRSIEKRITLDMKEINKRNDNDFCDDKYMQRTFSFSDFEEKYDNRKLHDDIIKLIDNDGKEFIYDVAYDDLIKREKELIKIGTSYLNVRTSDQLIEYSGEMKEIGYDIFKDNEIKNSTYLNPKYDRAELLFELYDYETRYQNTKINLINCYLEIYENTTDEEEIEKIAQIITNLIHIKPIVHYNDKYFSYSYLCEINSMENHLNLIKEMLIYSVEKTKGFYSYVETNIANRNNNNFQNSDKTNIPMGMPRYNLFNNKYYPVNMHYPGVNINFTDIYPNLGYISNMVYIQENLNKEFIDYYKLVFSNKTPDPIYVKCILWDIAYKKWVNLVNSNFEDDYIKKTTEKLFNEKQLEDLQIPDYATFIEKYKNNKKNKDNNYFMDLNSNKNSNNEYENSMNNLFLNSEFNYYGKDILLGLLKMISTRNKLLYSWIETEYCREIYNKQIYYMKVSVTDEDYENIHMFTLTEEESKNKDNTETKETKETIELNSQNIFRNDIGHENYEIRNIIEDSNFFNISRQEFKPLSYNELIDDEEEFELPSYNNINKYIDINELKKMLQALKLQQLEQMNYNISINLHKYCMTEIYPILIDEYIKLPPQDEVIINKKNNLQKTTDMKKQKISYNVNYNNIVFATTTEKMVLKIIIKNEWRKIYKTIDKSVSNFEGGIQEKMEYKLSCELKEKDNKIRQYNISSFMDKFDIKTNIFSQKKTFKKALKLNGFIKDILEQISNYGWFLQRNIIYRITNDIIKQADYVLTNITSIKEKLGNCSEVENYKPIKNILYYEWKKYNLLMKAFKYLSIDVLFFNGDSYSLYKKRDDLISIHLYYKLSINEKKLCDLKISKMEEVMNRKFSKGNKLKDENDLIKITEIEYLEQLLSLTGIRLEYYRIRMKNAIKIDFEKSKTFFKLYRNDILFNSIRLFYKNDSNQREYSEIIFDTTMELKGSETSYAVQILFEQYQVSLMSDDLYYYYTLNLYNHANILMAKIYNLQKISSIPFQYQKESVVFSHKENPSLNDNEISNIIEDSIIEVSKKDFFSAINLLAYNMFEWEQNRDISYKKFFCSLQTKMNDMFTEYEQKITNMNFEKKKYLEEYDCEVQLETSNTNDLIVIKLKELSKAIEDQKEYYKIEKKRIKEKVLNEYKELVKELVEKFIALKQQFNDYRISTKQETLKIMNESKNENLKKVIKSEMMPENLIEVSKKILINDEIINNYKDEINELKYMNTKMRAFYILLINKIKTQCKMEKRNLKDSYKKKETTLWKNYYDFKLRDDSLNDELRKARRLNKMIEEYKSQLSVQSDRKKVINMKKKINYYKNLNIVQLINELKQKTNLVLKLSEKLKRYTDEEVVTENDFNNDIFNSIQDLLNNECLTFNEFNLLSSKEDNNEHNEYDINSNNSSEIMRTISNDNDMTKDNYLEIINNLIKENSLLKKKITEQNTNPKYLKNEIVNVNEELYNIRRPQSAQSTKHTRYNSTEIRNINILNEQRFDNQSRYPPINSKVLNKVNKEEYEDSVKEKLYLDMTNKNITNKNQVKKRNKFILSETMNEDNYILNYDNNISYNLNQNDPLFAILITKNSIVLH
ncbi:hypothetical protein BCR32DRAFT_269023 [Anaeromyces robustus]|uniref:Uncharacterized protein n=1 Tax=Anaeromyces robustus TaxID=1754192 RepID=A0A1Y1X394_9FUNG|nr:hypothetical protein BCR32DRAFT_269023 [Anaeromyces robustus]|eukprot:ORX80135.1 hypothetical protein BCR32DRAFT_269023 [Anaeromyces robustus]